MRDVMTHRNFCSTPVIFPLLSRVTALVTSNAGPFPHLPHQLLRYRFNFSSEAYDQPEPSDQPIERWRRTA